MGFVDLHSHILPGLDDGARSVAESREMITGLVALGFDIICATPHQKAGQFMPSHEAIGKAHEGILGEVASMGLEVTIPIAAENMWDGVFFERFQTDCIPGYHQTLRKEGTPERPDDKTRRKASERSDAPERPDDKTRRKASERSDAPERPGDRSRVFLVEFTPPALPVGLLKHLFRLRAQGKLPVIAHPERYEPLWKDEARLHALAEQCAMVVDLGAVAGYHGRRQAKAARRMLERGIAHAAASDSHSAADVRVAAEGIAWIRKKLGESAVRRLLDDNPRRILAGELPASGGTGR